MIVNNYKMAFGTQLKEEEELNRRILENLEKIKLVGYAEEGNYG